jgi:hypothetical protein
MRQDPAQRGDHSAASAQAWRAYHDRMLAAMTASERRALLVGLTAFARELAAAHAEQLGHPGGQDTDHGPSESARPGKQDSRRGFGRW